MAIEKNIKVTQGQTIDLFAASGLDKGVATKLTLISDLPIIIYVGATAPADDSGFVPMLKSSVSMTFLDSIEGCWVKAPFGAEVNFSKNFTSDSLGGGGSGFNVPSDQVFQNSADRDSFFVSNPSKLVNGVECVVLTNAPEGLYQVYTSGAWEDRTAVVVGPKGDSGNPAILIDDTQSLSDKTYSSQKIESDFTKIDDLAESTETAYSSKKTNEAIAAYAPVLSGLENEIMKLDSSGKLVPSGVLSKKDGSLSVGSGSIDIGPHTISSAGEGVEVTNDSTGESYSIVFAGQGDDTGPVHRTLGTESVIETVASKTLDLTNHVSKFTAQNDIRVLRKPFTIDAVSSQTNVVMQVTDLAGSDLWTYGPFDINAGINVFTPDTVLDFRVGQYLITFTSKDGDVILKGGVSPTSGLDIVYALIPVKPWHDETLANIKSDDSTVRVISADPTSDITTSIDANGNLEIGANLSDYQRLDSTEINYPLIKMSDKKVSTEDFTITYTDSKLDEAFSPSTGIDSNGKAETLRYSGYLSSYGGISFQGNKIADLKFYKSFCELIMYASTNPSYMMISVAQLSEVYGRALDIKDMFLGFRLEGLKGSPGKFGDALPANATLGSKWDSKFRAIPNLKPDDPLGGLVDANDSLNTYFLAEDGTLTDSAGALQSGYTITDWSHSDSFKGADWGYSLRRGYIMQDESFVSDIGSPYYVAVINRNLALGGTKQYTAAITSGKFAFFESALEASLNRSQVATVDAAKSTAIQLIAENNLVQADLQARFGTGTVEINNLEFTVDSITANNINGEA